MSSFIMSKQEVVVLFDLMGTSSIPVGIKDLPQVDGYEYESIVDSFSARRLIDRESETFRPDKGLEHFLLPVVKAKRILLFNYGVDGTCTFNASLYFAKIGLVAIFDNGHDTVKFLTIDSVDDLLLFIPNINDITKFVDSCETYISYLLFDKDSSIVHCTRIDHKKNIARIVEGKKTPHSAPVEAADEVEISEYKEMLHDKLKEVHNVVGC
ncbi:MAG: hypothetical protein WAZ69_11570 [Trichococcus flocculiformis]